MMDRKAVRIAHAVDGRKSDDWYYWLEGMIAELVDEVEKGLSTYSVIVRWHWNFENSSMFDQDDSGLTGLERAKLKPGEN